MAKKKAKPRQRLPRTTDGTFVAATVAPQQLTADQTADQQNNGIGGNLFNTFAGWYGNGGTMDNPMGYPGWVSFYTGSILTYRWMLQLPVLRLVRSIDVGIISSSNWEYEADKGVPDNIKEFITSNMDRLRLKLIMEFFLRGRDYGSMSGEILWEERDGLLRIRDVKPLLNELCKSLQDRTGQVIGVRNNLRGQDASGKEVEFVDLALPYKGFHFTFDGEAGNPYGRSWLENCRATSFREWLNCSQQLQALGVKITGVVTIITAPSGRFPTGKLNADGTMQFDTYKASSERVISGLAKGSAGAYVPGIGFDIDQKGNIDMMKLMAQLIGKSMVTVDIKDFGSQASAIEGILSRMKHAEVNMFAAGLRSSRTGLEGEHGTKEEAGVHTDTGTLNAETEDRLFAAACQPLVDAQLEVNFGPKYIGKVRIKPASLIDRKSQVLRAFLMAVLQDRNIAIEGVAAADMDQIYKSLGIPFKAAYDMDAVRKAALAETANSVGGTPKKSPQVEPEGGRPEES